MARRKKIQVQKDTLLNTIINNSSDGIIVFNSKGIISKINHKAAKSFNYEDNELIKKNIRTIFPELSLGILKKWEEKEIKKILVGKKKEGKTIDYRLHLSKSIHKDITTYVITIPLKKNQKKKKLKKKLKNLTREKINIEKELSSLITINKSLRQTQFLPEKERELMELKSRFVSMASHEFRTPLALIKSSASIIGHYKTTELNERREKHILRIKNAVNNLTDILNDFASLARQEEGEIDNQPISFDIKNLMEDVVEEMRSFLKPNQKIITECPIKNTTLFLDNRWLKNIFINLISNAIKFSDEDTSIYCTILIKNKKLHIIVQDEGQGIPESAKKHIFTRFFRAKNVANIQGTGLGLNIIKRYLELFDGKIWFESELGEGSTFFIEIPLK